MKQTYDVVLQERLNAHMAQTGISQSKIAPLIGVSQTTLSHWRNNKYEGSVKEVEAKVEEYLRLEAEKKEAKTKNAPYRALNGYVPTSISEDVYRLIQYCHFEKGMVVVHGDAGIGKTKGAERYYRENPNTVLYIQATPSSGTLSSILKLLARALKIDEKQGKLDLMLSIKDKLESTNKVIVIDEAQHLKLQALEEIRTLSDPNDITGQTGTGIVLIGNTEVYDRMVGRQEARFAQLFSRIRMNKHYSTSKIKKSDIQLLFTDIDKTDKALNFLHGISQSKWGIRGAVNVYNNAANNEDISYKGLMTMATSMGIGLRS